MLTEKERMGKFVEVEAGYMSGLALHHWFYAHKYIWD